MATSSEGFVDTLPRAGAALGVLTGALASGMVWSSTTSVGLPTVASFVAATALLAAAGWFGAERVVALTGRLEESVK